MLKHLLLSAAVAATLLSGCVTVRPVTLDPAAWNSLPPAEKARASADGKYEGLLAILEVPGDVRIYGSLYDWGYWPGGTYAGVNGLPEGYWVYREPSWYLWQQVAAAPAR
jgi:hypothetical protein